MATPFEVKELTAIIDHPKVKKGEWSSPYNRPGWEVPNLGQLDLPFTPIIASIPSYFKQEWRLEAIKRTGASHSDYRNGPGLELVYYNPVNPPKFTTGVIGRKEHLDFSQLVKPTVDLASYSDGSDTMRRSARLRLATDQVISDRDLENISRLNKQTGWFTEGVNLKPFLFSQHRTAAHEDWHEIVGEDPTRFIARIYLFDVIHVLSSRASRRYIEHKSDLKRKVGEQDRLAEEQTRLEEEIQLLIAHQYEFTKGIEQKVAAIINLPKPSLWG